MVNAVNVIFPYPKFRTWVFDDPDRELKAEPFVFGIPEIIDYIIKEALGITKRCKFKLLFSKYELPNYHLVLRKLPFKTVSGCWYGVEEIKTETVHEIARHEFCGWLCPATLKYFKDYPEKIFIYVEMLT